MGSAKDKFDSFGREKVQCKICNKYYHRLDIHLKTVHGKTVEEYMSEWPGVEILSEHGKTKLNKETGRIVAGDEEGATRKEKESDGKEKHCIRRAEVQRRDIAELSEIDLAYVPPHDSSWVVDETVMTFWEDLAIGLNDREPIYIGGPTGCGKTKGVLVLASALRQPVRRIQLNRDFRVAEFVGQRTLEESASGKTITGWKDGVLTEAMRNGWWLLLDEVDQAHPDILMKLQGVLEGTALILTENFGEVVHPHEYFRIIATANTFGRGDETGLYTGAKIMNEATMDRFGVVIDANYPSEKTEVEIIRQVSGIPAGQASKMVECARKIREAQAKEECSCTFSTRRLVAWARKVKRYGDIQRASNVAVLNKLNYDDRRFVGAIIQRYFAGKIDERVSF